VTTTWNLDDLRTATLSAVRDAVQLLAHPDLDERWRDGSAASGMTIGELATHTAQMISALGAWLEADPPDPAVVEVRSFDEIYGSGPLDSAGAGEGGEGATLADMRRWAAEASVSGAETIHDQAAEELERLEGLLAGARAGRLIPAVGAPGVAMSLEDYLRTRCVEMVVHTEDLAASIAIAAPTPDPVAAAVAEGSLAALCRGPATAAEGMAPAGPEDHLAPETDRGWDDGPGADLEPPVAPDDFGPTDTAIR
jgi:hypothetical protein